ncbi:lactoylglutathione lyase [Mycobacterium malmoense]|uniref:VOC family protein n=1 Tax=Mycobacterium malmoense TaxID=1780 RepID=UPI00080B0DE2|nr:VOC family protein [Mycobacterium malmoense]OCB30140.1 lactoylglutathione lyase [Mycobacterium malmoense]
MTLPVQSPTQIAWVTTDLDATETALTGLLGVKKWVRIPEVHFAPDSCSYLGKPADFVASISLSYLGDMQLELIQPVRGENIYSDFLRDSGPGLHHICMEAETPRQFDAVLAGAAEFGAAVVQQGVMPGGIRFAYLSAPQAAVPFLEIAYIAPEMRAFYDYIKQEQRP